MRHWFEGTLSLAIDGMMDSTTPPPFLRLPMEIRLIIYKFFLPLTTTPNRWNCGPQQSIFLISRKHAHTPPELSCLGREPRPVARQTVVLRLRAVNHQIYEEVNTLINVNPLNLRITDSLTFRDCSDNIVLDLMQHAWMTENVRHIEIYIAHDGMRFTYPLSRDPVRYRMPEYPSRYGKLWSTVRKYLFGEKKAAQQTHNLQRLATVLGKFRRLETVDLMTDHDTLFDIWSDPVGDSNAFLPLVKGGVVIEFKFPPFYDPAKVSLYRNAFDEMFRRKQSWSVWPKKSALRWVPTPQNDRCLEAVES